MPLMFLFLLIKQILNWICWQRSLRVCKQRMWHQCYVSMNGLVLVIASKSPLMDLVSERCRTSPFFNIFEQVALKPFTKVEAEEFAQAKSKEARFNDDECVALLKYGQIDKQEWPPLRLQLVGKMLLEDKNLAAAGNPDYYQPGEPEYWKDFKQRLEEKYGGTVS